MDKINDGIKRKKLKTRKNLDELRRKSRGKNDTNEKNINRFGVTYKTNKFLTSQRLTLTFCKKAVQSKTVLRSKSRIIQNTPKYGSIEWICDGNNNDDFNKVINSGPVVSSERSPQQMLEASLTNQSPVPFSPTVTDNNNNSRDAVRASILERDFSDEDELADTLLNYISEYIIPDVDEDVIPRKKVSLQASLENIENELREEALQIQNDANSTVLHIISDESVHTVENFSNLPRMESHVDSDGYIFPNEINNILGDSPLCAFYPHKLNQ